MVCMVATEGTQAQSQSHIPSVAMGCGGGEGWGGVGRGGQACEFTRITAMEGLQPTLSDTVASLSPRQPGFLGRCALLKGWVQGRGDGS